jgi:hypothetical protein
MIDLLQLHAHEPDFQSKSQAPEQVVLISFAMPELLLIDELSGPTVSRLLKFPGETFYCAIDLCTVLM